VQYLHYTIRTTPYAIANNTKLGWCYWVTSRWAKTEQTVTEDLFDTGSYEAHFTQHKVNSHQSISYRVGQQLMTDKQLHLLLPATHFPQW